MPGTAATKGKTPAESARFPSEILAYNLGQWRMVPKATGQRAAISQTELAERMQRLGFPWLRQTVSEVERAIRGVDVDELVALAVALEVSVAALLDPRIHIGGVEDESGTTLLHFVRGPDIDVGAVIPASATNGLLFAISDDFETDGSHRKGVGDPTHPRLVWDESGNYQEAWNGTPTSGSRRLTIRSWEEYEDE